MSIHRPTVGRFFRPHVAALVVVVVVVLIRTRGTKPGRRHVGSEQVLLGKFRQEQRSHTRHHGRRLLAQKDADRQPQRPVRRLDLAQDGPQGTAATEARPAVVL